MDILVIISAVSRILPDAGSLSLRPRGGYWQYAKDRMPSLSVTLPSIGIILILESISTNRLATAPLRFRACQHFVTTH
jgi:hypothetical protein